MTKAKIKREESGGEDEEMKLMISIMVVLLVVLLITGLQLPFAAADEYDITGHQQGIHDHGLAEAATIKGIEAVQQAEADQHE
jgi:hypothetical protein